MLCQILSAEGALQSCGYRKATVREGALDRALWRPVTILSLFSSRKLLGPCSVGTYEFFFVFVVLTYLVQS